MIRRHINTGLLLGGMSRRPHAFRRAGFSLVEILVVLTIIILLASLILAAVLRALDAGTRTENFTEIAQIESAIGEAKRKLNLPQIPTGPFHLKPTYTGTEPELEFLTAAWPQAYPGPTGAPWTGINPFPNTHLDSNQTLLFFLTGSSITNFTGFSTNPAQPFAPVSATNAGAPRVGPFLQSSTKYFSLAPVTRSGLALQSTTSPTQANPTPGVTIPVAGGQFPWLIDPYGLPFAYFPAYDGKTNMYYAPTTNKVTTFNSPPTTQFYTLTFTNGTTSTVIPYQSNGAYINPQGFQIISSGKDMYFGSSGTLPPSAAVGYDDQANFSKVTLGGGIQ